VSSSVAPQRARELLRILDNQADAFRQLVSVTQREQETLKRGDLDNLKSITLEKQALATRLDELERIRERLVARLSRELNLSEGAYSSEILAGLDEDIDEHFSALQSEFARLGEQLLSLNHGNQILIEARLAQIDATLDYLARNAAAPDGYYTIKGENHTLPAVGNVLNRSA
jgi:flagellar biosynthesis/type III secretory pathway chaperone